MANPAADIRALTQADFPGATVVARGKSWLRHRHPSAPNRFLLDHSIGPLHYGDNADQEIDTAIVADTGAWQWRMIAADWQMHARSVFNAGNLVEYRDRVTQQWVIFDPQSLNWVDENSSRQQIAIKQAVTGQVSGDVLNFPAAWGAGRHFQYQASPGKLQKLITIDSAANLPAETLAGNTIWLETEFSLSTSTGVDVYLDGVKWAKANNVRVKTANRIEFRDTATGQSVLWVLDYPRAWDSAGNTTIGEMEVRRQGGASNLFITIRIPKAWVDAATFPIFLDPTVDYTVGASSDDALENNSGTVTLADTSIYLNLNPALRYGAARWTGVTIPDGSTINSGYVSWYAFDALTISNTIRFEKNSSPATFVASANNISGRARTTASVAWSGTASNNAYNNSPSLAAIFSELIGAYSYASGAPMAVIHIGNTGSGSFDPAAYDSGLAKPPKLHIDYTVGGGKPQTLIASQSVKRAAYW